MRTGKQATTGAVRLALVLLLSTMGVVLGARQAGAGPAAHVRAVKSPKTMFPATGYFSLGQSKGRWWLVTPQGQPFYAAASDTVSPAGSGTDQVTGVCPYCKTVASNYPSTSAWGRGDARAVALVGLQHTGGVFGHRRSRVADALRAPADHGQRGRLVLTVLRHPVSTTWPRPRSLPWPTTPI